MKQEALRDRVFWILSVTEGKPAAGLADELNLKHPDCDEHYDSAVYLALLQLVAENSVRKDNSSRPLYYRTGSRRNLPVATTSVNNWFGGAVQTA